MLRSMTEAFFFYLDILDSLAALMIYYDNMLILELQFVVPFLAGLFSLFLGIFTFATNRHSATHTYFLATTTIIAVWSMLVAIFHLPITTANHFWNMHWVVGLFIAPVYLLLFMNFPETKLIIRPTVRMLVWGGAMVMGTAFALWPQEFIQYYVIETGSIPQIVVGPFAWIFDIYFGTYLLIGFAFMIRAFLRSYGRVRAQILTGLIGLAIGTTGGFITNVFMSVHFGRELIWLGPIFTIIGTTSVSYMIFGVMGSRTRLLPVATLGIAVVAALAFQMASSTTPEAFIFNGAVFAGTVLIGVFLIGDTLIESTDVRRLQNLTHKLQKTNVQLQRADKMKSDFLSIASHHLRTPLTHIKWSLSGFVDGDYDNLPKAEQKKIMTDLLTNNERLMEFVNSLLDTSRIESGKMQAEKKPVNIQQLIGDIMKKSRDFAKNYYRVSITMSSSPKKLPHVTGDPELLQKVFENIIDNAIIYNRPGGKVRITMEEKKNFLITTIKDSGIGMPPEDLKKAGRKFFRSAHAKQFAAEGTGLGVFIAKHILKLHGGNMQIESVEDKGTTVTIALPITRKSSG
ncbi:hypothetical protein IID24_04385 [Patescibacteria group bacterium]|nr:hypothetical protein [Patescibacteria group bacterium]